MPAHTSVILNPDSIGRISFQHPTGSRIKSGMTFLFFGVFFVLVSIIIPQNASAQSKKGSIEIAPAFVEVTLTKPDEEAQVPIVITNHSSGFMSLELFPIDFKQEDGNGAISFVGQDGSYSYSLSSFLSFESRSLELGPQEKKEFIVAVKNRQDLSPGGHYAAVIAKLIVKDTAQTPIAPSVSSLILVRKVGGEQFNLSLKDVTFPPMAVVFSMPDSVVMQFQNEGNIHLVPYGRVEMKDMFGRLIYDGSINSSSLRVFPSSRRDIATKITQLAPVLPFSFMTMSVRGQDSLKKTSFIRTESFIFINPLFVLALIVLVILFIRLRKRLVRRKEASTPSVRTDQARMHTKVTDTSSRGAKPGTGRHLAKRPATAGRRGDLKKK